MASRKTFNEILSADEAAFVKSKPSKKSKPDPKPKTKKEQPSMTRPARTQKFVPETPPQPESTGQPAAAASMGSVNARIDPAITTALMRASLERRIQRLTPSTHREIVAEALTDWLKKHGYSK